MRSKAPPLLPIFRTQLQGEVLALLLDNPEHEWTMSELAQTTSAALTSIHAEIVRLESGGLATSRKVGRTRLTKANPSNPVIEPLTQVVLSSFGPKVVVGQEFADLGAERVLIFGSWAARYMGVDGITPNDIDVLVIGDNVDEAEMYRAAERTEQRVKRAVNPVCVSSQMWCKSTTPLIDEIKRRPYVEVLPVSSI